MELISTKLTNLVSLEQSNHKPKGMCGGGLLKVAQGCQGHGKVMEFLEKQGCPQAIVHSDCAIYSNKLCYLHFQNYCRITVILV